MAERKGDCLPPHLDPVAYRLRAGFCAGLTGRNPREFIYPPSQRQIEESLAHFYDFIRDSDQLSQLIREEAKKPEVNPENFMLSRLGWINKYGPNLSSCFNLDGKYSFALFQGNPGNHDGACISFNIFDNAESLRRFREKYKLMGINPSTLERNDLIIVQLQGPTLTPKKGEFQVLSDIRWEIILVELVVGWARVAGFPRVLLLPGENNWNFASGANEHRQPRNIRLLTRYNGTATRCGFKRPAGDSPFILNFTSKFRF